MKYLVAGLGNIGPKYENTRHNIGFKVLDALAKASNLVFTPQRYADLTTYRYRGRILILIKPSTYMNLSGKAVSYWLQKENIPIENLLVVVDDLALPFGQIRIRSKGSDAGHNGLKSINELLGTQNYARLRFGIGNEFLQGQQIDYVLGDWSPEQKSELPARIEKMIEAIQSFPIQGVDRTMSSFNNS